MSKPLRHYRVCVTMDPLGRPQNQRTCWVYAVSVKQAGALASGPWAWPVWVESDDGKRRWYGEGRYGGRYTEMSERAGT
jgi:hypothetical protein